MQRSDSPIDSAEHAHGSGRSAVSARSLILGTAAAVAVALVVPFNDYKLHNTYFAGNFFPTGPFAILLAFVLTINAFLWRFFPRSAFSTIELLTVFGMSAFASLIPSCSMGRMLYSGLIAPWYYSPSNAEWEPYLKYFPKWMFPCMDTDSPIVQTFFNGLDPGQPLPWAAWLRPLVLWGIFAVALFGGSMLLMNLLLHQWSRSESLPFPIAAVCLELVEAPEQGRAINANLRSGMLWVAAGGVFVVHLINGLTTYYPAVPTIKRSWNLWSALSSFPLDHLPGYLKTGTIFFTAVGLGYLVSQDVLLSIWIFPVLMGFIQMVCRAYASWQVDVHYEPNTVGAYVMLAIMLTWRGRKHWRVILKEVVAPSGRGIEESFLSYRWSVGGLVLCVLVVVVWLCAAGMSVWGALAFVVGFYIIFLVLSRLVTAAGLFYAQPGFNWQDIIRTVGAFQLTVQDFAAATLPTLSLCDLRNVPMPYTANLLRAADRSDAKRRRRFFGALFGALLIGYVFGSASHLFMHYRWGANTTLLGWGKIHALKHSLMPYLSKLERGHELRNVSIVAGAFVYAGLDWLRMAVPWWPLHPLGYLTYTCWPVRWMWPSFCLVWWIKFLILRYGGAGLYMKLRPLFIGLVVGECVSVALWMLVKVLLEFSPVVRPAVFLLPA